MARKIHISFLKNNFLFFANFVPIFIFSFNFITISLTIHCLETICSLFGNESLWSKLNRISQSWSNNKWTQNWNTFQSNPLSLYPFCRSRGDGNREYERERSISLATMLIVATTATTTAQASASLCLLIYMDFTTVEAPFSFF